MRLFYTLIFYVCLPLIFLRLWQRGKQSPQYRLRWKERCGITPAINSERPVIWFHTVSVGEFIAAKPLIQHYIDNNQYHILITCMTPTGSERVTSTFGNAVSHCYLPYDLPLFINAFLNACKPQLFVCLETELWPNFIRACHKRQIPSTVPNARLPPKSARGYRFLRSLSRRMLKKISIAAIQNEGDAGRFVKLGLQPKNAKVIGNIKFDLSIDKNTRHDAQQLKEQFNPHNQLLIAASTHRGEDEIILACFTHLKQKHPQLKLIIVPRHPERFDDVFNLCKNTGFTCTRRSRNTQNNADILLGDTMGELLTMLGASNYAFIGGSFVDNGGHNYIEPAAWALPILSGPSTYNFRTIAEELQHAGGLQIAEDGAQLSLFLDSLLNSDSQTRERGAAAQQVAERNRGALVKLINLIDSELDKLAT